MRDTARILGPGASPPAALCSCRYWGRLANLAHHPGSARARHPDVVSLPATIQLTAPLVLSDEGHQGIEHVRHGAGRLTQPAGAAGLRKLGGRAEPDHIFELMLLQHLKRPWGTGSTPTQS